MPRRARAAACWRYRMGVGGMRTGAALGGARCPVGSVGLYAVEIAHGCRLLQLKRQMSAMVELPTLGSLVA